MILPQLPLLFYVQGKNPALWEQIWSFLTGSSSSPSSWFSRHFTDHRNTGILYHRISPETMPREKPFKIFSSLNLLQTECPLVETGQSAKKFHQQKYTSKCKHVKWSKRGGCRHRLRLEGKLAANKGLIWSPPRKKTAVLKKWLPPVMKQQLANRKGSVESQKHLSSQGVARQVPGGPFMHSQRGSTRFHANSTQTVRWS